MTPVELPIFLTSSFIAASIAPLYRMYNAPEGFARGGSEKSSPRLFQLLQPVDQAGDHREPALPERRVARVEAERLEQLGIRLGAAGRQHAQVAFGKAGLGL